MDGACKRCGVLETERHVFFQCPFAEWVWEIVPTSNKPIPTSISTPASILLMCSQMVRLPPSGLYGADLYLWILWYLWVARNKLLFDNLIMSAQEVVTQVVKEARCWQAAQTDLITPVRVKTRVPQLCGEVHQNHCFVDAAWNAGTQGGGFGCIFKNQALQTVHQVSANRCFVGSAFVAKALAVKTALQEAVNFGLRTLTVWSDSQSLINVLSNQLNSIDAQGVLFDIKFLCTLFSRVLFYHVPRLSNTEADGLAKIALLNISDPV